MVYRVGGVCESTQGTNNWFYDNCYWIVSTVVLVALNLFTVHRYIVDFMNEWDKQATIERDTQKKIEALERRFLDKREEIKTLKKTLLEKQKKIEMLEKWENPKDIEMLKKRFFEKQKKVETLEKRSLTKQKKIKTLRKTFLKQQQETKRKVKKIFDSIEEERNEIIAFEQKFGIPPRGEPSEKIIVWKEDI